MGFNWEDLGFSVKMGDGRHLNVAGGYSEGGILDSLDSIEGRGWGIGKPDWGAVCEE